MNKRELWYNDELVESTLLKPIKELQADKLIIISGYASHNMASWHIKKINESKLSPVAIELTFGMPQVDGISKDLHEGLLNLSKFREEELSSFTCKYIYQGAPVHSKIYIWLKNDKPVIAFAGSANYSQNAFSKKRREYMVQCNHEEAYAYYLELENDSIVCNHGEIEEYVKIYSNNKIDIIQNNNEEVNVPHVTLSLLKKDGQVGHGSGINWGHRKNGTKRELNQAYIPLPSKIAKSNFFPLNKQHFSVITDDRKQLILRVQQQNDKAITTPLNNSQLGEYFRNRMGLENGSFVTLSDFENYGRSDVTFYKIDEDQFYMDFSV